MKKFILKYYPFFINIYTIWILYMMFFAYNRGALEMGEYFVRPFPFQSIRYLFSDQVTHYETFKNIIIKVIKEFEIYLKKK